MVNVILVIVFSIWSYVLGHDAGWDDGFYKGWMKGLDDGLNPSTMELRSGPGGRALIRDAGSSWFDLGLEDVTDLTGHN